MFDSALQKQHGVSLVGLLIALAISGVLLNGLISVFASNQNTSRMINDFGSLQESVRAANDTLETAIRQAGHFGGIPTDDISVINGLNITGKGNCNSAWLTDTSTLIRAYDGAASLTNIQDLPANCISVDDYLPNTDLLSLKYASALELTEYDDMAADTVYVRTVLSGTDAGKGQILQGRDKNSAIGLSFGFVKDQTGTYNYTFENELYYVRQCTQKINDICQDNIPSLVRLHLEDSQLIEQVIVSGVEQFQIEFGLDTDNDLNADNFSSADNIPNWNNVVSIQYSLVIRGEAQDQAIKDTKTYTLAGDIDYRVASEYQQYRRRAYTKLVQLRNMTRG